MSEKEKNIKKFLLVEPENNIIHPMEDYNILVDLIVRNASRTPGNEIEEISFVLGTYKFGDENNENKNTMVRDFTASYLDASANEIFNDDVNKECLGVDSIDIDYSNWQYPQVTIKFTDVRAQALMMPEENNYVHYLADEIENKDNVTYYGLDANKKATSLFTSFFRFPYPEFILKVKGFYGHAISFRLTVNEFSSSFNSETGDFDVVVSFIGHLYGLLTDIPMKYILLAPYIDNKDYWNGIGVNEKGEVITHPFTFGDEGNTPMPTLLELARNILNVNDRLNKISPNDEDLKKYKNIQNRCGLLSKIVKGLKDICSVLKSDDFKTSVLESKYDNVISLCNDCVNNGYGEDITKVVYNTNNPDDTINLINCLEWCKENIEISKEKEKNVEQASLLDTAYLSIKKASNSNKEIIKSKISAGLRNIWLAINEKIGGLEGSNKANTNALSKKLEGNVKELLGFNPTIENIFKIIFAHIDTFMYHYNECIEAVKNDININKTRIKLNEENSDVVSSNGESVSAPPFPLIHSGENNSKNTSREHEILYPTHHRDISEGDMPELTLVDKMLDGASRTVGEINSLFSFMDSKIEMIPTTVIDVINEYNNPYSFYRFSDVGGLMNNNNQSIIDDSITVLSLRSILYTLLNQSNPNNNLLGTIGEVEAYNFFDIHKDNDVILNGIINKINGGINKDDEYAINTVNLVNTCSNGFININNNILTVPINGDKIQKTNGVYNGLGVNSNIVKKQDIPVNFYSTNDIKDSFIEKDKYYKTFLGKGKNQYEFFTFENENTYDNFVNLFEKIENDENIEIKHKSNLYESWKECFQNVDKSKAKELKLGDDEHITNFLNIDEDYGEICKLPYRYYESKEDFEGDEYTKYEFKDDNKNYQNLVSGEIIEDNINKLYYKKFIHDYNFSRLYHFQNEKTDDPKTTLYNKAIIFLSDKYYIEKENTNDNSVIISFIDDFFGRIKRQKEGKINNYELLRVSYQTLIYIGGLIWCCEHNINYKDFNNKYNTYLTKISRLYEWLDYFNNHYLQLLSDNEKTILKDYFYNWVNNYFVKYVDLFEIRGKNNKYLTSDEFDALFNTLKESYATNVLMEKTGGEWKYSNSIWEKMNDNVLNNYNYFFPSAGFILKKDVSYEMTQKLLSDIYIYRPYKFWDWNGGNSLLPVNINYLYTIFNSFIKKLNELKNKKDGTNKITESDVNDEAKLSLYLTLKNLYDKWQINICDDKDKWVYPNRQNKNNELLNVKSEYSNYKFVDSKHNNIGNEVLVDCKYLVEYINTILNNPNSDLSLYEFMYQIATSCNMQMLTLPISNYMTDFNSEKMGETFKPNFKLMSSLDNSLEGSTHLCIYNDLPSSNLDIGNQIGDYEYTNDGTDLANTLNLFYYDKDGKQSDDSIPCFMVNYGQQNQSIFKNIRVNMDNPQATEYSIGQQFYIANKYGDGASNQAFFKGQNLFRVYSNHSYTCTVDMMGCANITPYMHFYLNGLPLFKGVYMIISVKHHVEAGNMITTFTGVRQNINKLPFTKEALYLSSFKDKLNALEVKNDEVNFSDTYIGYDTNLLKTEYEGVSVEPIDNYKEYNSLRKLTREYNGNIYPLIFFKLDIENQRYNYDSSPEKTAESAWNGLKDSMKAIIVRLARTIEKNNLPYAILITSGHRTKGKYSSYHDKGLAIDIHGIDLPTNGLFKSNSMGDTISYEQLAEVHIDRKYSPYLFDLIVQTCYDDISELFWENLENTNNGDMIVSNTIHFAIQDNENNDNKKTISQGSINGKYKKYLIDTNSEKIFEPLSRFFLKICSRLINKDSNAIYHLSNFYKDNKFIDEVSELKKKILKF